MESASPIGTDRGGGGGCSMSINAYLTLPRLAEVASLVTVPIRLESVSNIRGVTISRIRPRHRVGVAMPGGIVTLRQKAIPRTLDKTQFIVRLWL